MFVYHIQYINGEQNAFFIGETEDAAALKVVAYMRACEPYVAREVDSRESEATVGFSNAEWVLEFHSQSSESIVWSGEAS